MWIHRCIRVLSVPFLALAVSRPALAQSPKWDVEFFVGSVKASRTVRGTPGTLPGPQTSFLVQGNPPTPLSTRPVVSWFFGDGATLFNQSSAFVKASGITPLDDALKTFIGARERGSAYGVRLTRTIASRFGLEIGFESSDTPLTLSKSATAAFDASRASFVTGWNSLIAAEQARITNPSAITNPVVTSAFTSRGGAARQMFVTVSGKAHIIDHGPVMPYVLGGGGIAIGRGAEQHVALSGAYQFSNFGFPKSETDQVDVVFRENPLAPVIVFGAGADGPLGRRAGWRIDFRALSRGNTSTVELSAGGQRTIAAAGQANAFAFFTDPAIQFSSNPGIKSSLDGFLDDLETFHGTGRVMQTSLTAGVFLRF